MNRNECAHAAQLFLAFLKQVGPIEAAWAMNTVLETLVELPPGNDHVAAAMTALDESLAEFDELAQVASSEPADAGEKELLTDEHTPKPPRQEIRQGQLIVRPSLKPAARQP